MMVVIIMCKFAVKVRWRSISLIIFTWTIVTVFPALVMGKTTSLDLIGPSKKCTGNTINRQLLAGDHHRKNLSPEENDRLRRNFKEWKSFSPENRKEFRHRMDHWRELSPGERELYQKRYHQFEQLPPDERGRVRKKLDRWDNLSPQEKDEIRRTFPRH
jgi:hypothetical protein